MASVVVPSSSVITPIIQWGSGVEDIFFSLADAVVSAASFFTPAEWVALAVALVVVACLAPGGWRDARRQEMVARQRAEAGLPRA